MEALAFANGVAILLAAGQAFAETQMRFGMMKAKAAAEGRTTFTEEELAVIRGEREAAVAAAIAMKPGEGLTAGGGSVGPAPE